MFKILKIYCLGLWYIQISYRHYKITYVYIFNRWKPHREKKNQSSIILRIINSTKKKCELQKVTSVNFITIIKITEKVKNIVKTVHRHSILSLFFLDSSKYSPKKKKKLTLSPDHIPFLFSRPSSDISFDTIL